jgi:hypothetical protein
MRDPWGRMPAATGLTPKTGDVVVSARCLVLLGSVEMTSDGETPGQRPFMAGIVTDRLIIGAGAGGVANADALLENSDSGVVLADRHPRTGGHWNDVYLSVRIY